MKYRDIEFRVFDLHEGKVLYGEDIPAFGYGLVESLRLLNSETWALSQYTDNKDIKRQKIYEGDIVSIYKHPKNNVVPIDRIEEELSPIGIGLVECSFGTFQVKTVSLHEVILIDLYRGEGNLEFKVEGNHLENKELYPLYITEEYYQK